MEGVNILNSYEVITKYIFNWKSFWIGFALGCIIVLLVIIAAYRGNIRDMRNDIKELITCGLIVIIIASIVIGLISGHLFSIPVDYETRHEVSINENVNMQEFMEKYEILETRGHILVVREIN